MTCPDAMARFLLLRGEDKAGAANGHRKENKAGAANGHRKEKARQLPGLKAAQS
jgi:hypothetical protein